MDTNKLIVSKTIKTWDEAIPLGNGELGCLIWDTPDKLRFSIDKAGIWDCSAPPDSHPDFHYQQLLEWVGKRKQRKINKVFDDCYSCTTPTKLPTGKIILDLGVEGNILSELDFNRAEATLAVGGVIVKSFIHAQQDYGMIEVNKVGVNLSIDNPKFGVKGKRRLKLFSRGISQSLKNLHYDAATFGELKRGDVDYIYFSQPTNDKFYGIVAAKKECAGRTVIVYSVGMGSDSGFIDDKIAHLEGVIAASYSDNIAGHAEWWSRYSQLSSITLPDKKLEHYWNYTNYLLASCSREGKYPMPLQGVWTADNGNLPPWKGDYHHDLNTQMSYTSYLKAGRINEGKSYIDYLIKMSQQGRDFARKYYGVNGICMPSVMDIEGHALGGWAQYALSPTNQLWICCIMARHYHYSGDIDYLKDRIYPYMAEVGEFIIGMLVDKNGVYKLQLSTSPEIHDNSLKAWLTPNTNYDLAIMHAFMSEMITLSRKLGYDEEAIAWMMHKSKLEPLAVSVDNVLMISPDYKLKESHRHLSHCMAIYPLRTMQYNDNNKTIIDSTIANLEELGIHYWVGYTLGWIANLYVVVGDGDKAYTMVRDFITHYCTDSGFHVNGDHRNQTACGMKYRYFTLEGNFIAADAINNMLLYSEEDGLKLFPAIPASWTECEFDNLLGYGGIKVSAKLVCGELSYVKVTAPSDMTINIINSLEGMDSVIHLLANQSYIWQSKK